MARTVRRIGLGVAAVLVLAAGVAVVSDSSPATADREAVRYRETVLRHEEAIASCMRERGFEYVAALPADVLVEEARAKAVAEGRDVRAAVAEAQQRAPADPNEAPVGQLSPERQQAWGDALWGAGTWAGCFDHTYPQVWGVDLDGEFERAEQTLARVRADPGVVAAGRTYVACMTARGYPVKDAEDIHALVGRQREVLDEAAGQRYARAADAAHSGCVGPYEEVFNRVHRRLGTR